MAAINFLENAKFGDKFIDGKGKIYIYHYKEKYKASDGKLWDYHWLIREPVYYDTKVDDKFYYHPYKSFIFIDGYGVPTNLKYYSIESLLESPNKEYLIIGKCE